MKPEQVLVLILGAGGATFLWTAVRSYLAIKDNADTREDKAVANLERYRLLADQRADRAEKRLGWQADVADFWRRRSVSLEALLIRKGHEAEIPPLPPRPAPPALDPQDDPANA